MHDFQGLRTRMARDLTTISLKRDTKRRLEKVMEYGESSDGIVRK